MTIAADNFLDPWRAIRITCGKPNAGDNPSMNHESMNHNMLSCCGTMYDEVVQCLIHHRRDALTHKETPED